MALIKCAECGADISSEASACPHCGYPIAKTRSEIVTTEPKRSKSSVPWLSVLFPVVSLVLFGLWLFLDPSASSPPPPNEFDKYLASGSHSESEPSGQNIPLQEVKNLGYDFYLGQIEEPGVNDISDDIKNQITKVAYDTHFPESLLKNTPIIFLNNLALTGDQYISLQNARLHVPELKADFLSEGGLYAPYATNTAVIFINKSSVTGDQLSDVLAHEFGHAIGSTLSDSQWKTFYQLRNIPSGTPRAGTNWNLSPEEDFAEVYKNVFTGGDVSTFYGLLMPTMGVDMACEDVYQQAYQSYLPKYDMNDPMSWMKSITGTSKIDYTAADSKAEADPNVQACRRSVLSDPSKYKSDWNLGMPYKSTVGPKTKQFIEALAASSSPL